MKRVQIQLPDEIFARAKKTCDTREISLAELVCRGLEYILTVYNEPAGGQCDWRPPSSRDVGWKGLSHAEIKEQAQLTTSEVMEMAKGRKRH